MVDSLRDQWTALTELAEKVRMRLLSEQRLLFEREVDKQVKRFVVETIQFRNSFDTEGPLVPGLFPNEAVTRLGQLADSQLDCHSRNTYIAVIISTPKPFYKKELTCLLIYFMKL